MMLINISAITDDADHKPSTGELADAFGILSAKLRQHPTLEQAADDTYPINALTLGLSFEYMEDGQERKYPPS